ncbi:MAG: V-type ATPase 116kDa subunit family protein [Rikenellaceae bacterium]
MIKYTFLLHYLQQKELLESLGSTAIVDITVSDWLPDSDDKSIIAELSRIKADSEKIKSFALLNEKREAPYEAATVKFEGADDLLTKFEAAAAKIEQLSPLVQKLQREEAELSTWGEFDYSLVEKLEELGLYIHYYECSEKRFDKKWESDYNLVVCNSSNIVNFVIVSQSNTPEVIEGAQIQKQLKSSITECKAELKSVENEILESHKMIIAASSELEMVEKYDFELKERLSERKVVQCGKEVAEGKVIIIEGYAPVDKCDEVDALFESNSSVVVIKDKPKAGDNPPILLKNNRFARLSEMITRLYSLPQYTELDLTPFFAPFFVFFAGICLGDLGYGALLFGASLWGFLKFKDSQYGDISALVMWCSVATMIMGCVTGTFFGISLAETETFGNLPFLGSMDMFTFALVVGIIQILYGMFIRAFYAMKCNGWRYGIPHLAWALVIMVSGFAYLAEGMGINFTMSSPIYSIVVGILLAAYIFFSNPAESNPLKNIGGGLWNVYNAATGLLGDTLSYIRLFALGLSSGIIAGVFNDLAVGMSGDIPVVKYVIMAIILLLGHGINLFMSIISSFVHPLRLTFVEFYKSAGFEGGGRDYVPFKKTAKGNL